MYSRQTTIPFGCEFEHCFSPRGYELTYCLDSWQGVVEAPPPRPELPPGPAILDEIETHRFHDFFEQIGSAVQFDASFFGFDHLTRGNCFGAWDDDEHHSPPSSLAHTARTSMQSSGSNETTVDLLPAHDLVVDTNTPGGLFPSRAVAWDSQDIFINDYCQDTLNQNRGRTSTIATFAQTPSTVNSLVDTSQTTCLNDCMRVPSPLVTYGSESSEKSLEKSSNDERKLYSINEDKDSAERKRSESDVLFGSDMNFDNCGFVPENNRGMSEEVNEHSSGVLCDVNERSHGVRYQCPSRPMRKRRWSDALSTSSRHISSAGIVACSERCVQDYKYNHIRMIRSQKRKQKTQTNGNSRRTSEVETRLNESRQYDKSRNRAIVKSVDDQESFKLSLKQESNPRTSVSWQQCDSLTEEQKRCNHILSEQRRRNIIKEGFERMNKLVPNLRSTELSKCMRLTTTSEWLNSLIRGNVKLKSELNELINKIDQM